VRTFAGLQDCAPFVEYFATSVLLINIIRRISITIIIIVYAERSRNVETSAATLNCLVISYNALFQEARANNLMAC
jgi:hypothetical protein